MSTNSALLLLVGIIGASLTRTRRVVRRAEDFQARVRNASLMPFHLYDEPS